MAASATAAAALVTRTDTSDGGGYLLVNAAGRPEWVARPEAATVFASMREAMRAAMRLPAKIRAYGLPLEPELKLYSTY
jgi:hypothetical protein